MGEDSTSTQGNKGDSHLGKTNILEWVVFGLGLLLILGVMACLVYQLSTHNPAPADLQVEFMHIPTPNNPHKYQLSVQNSGGKTAKNVIVELSLIKADAVLESSEIDFDYVPYTSKRIGWVVFSTNPAEADSVVSKVVSYSEAP